MGELKNLVVQVLDDDEKKFAESLLQQQQKGEVSLSQFYVRGFGDEDVVRQLTERGLIVESFGPEELSLNWLEPIPAAQEAEALGDDDGAEEPPAAMQEACAEVDQVVLIQLNGPMRTAWREQLDALGVTLIVYKPEFAYKARIKAGTRPAVENLPFVTRVVDYQPGKKLQGLRRESRRARIIQTEKDYGFTGSDDIAATEPGEAVGSETVATAAEPVSAIADTEAAPAEEAPTSAAAEDVVGYEMTSESEAMAAPPPVILSSGPISEPVAWIEEESGEKKTPSAPRLVTYELKCHLPADTPKVAEILTNDERASAVAAGRFRVRFACEENSPLLKDLLEMTNIVSKIDPYIEPEIADIAVRQEIGIEPAGAPPLPWTGEGVLVGVADTGIDKKHVDLKNRVESIILRAGPLGEADENGHGTHVCGVIAGDGTASQGEVTGVATGARLVVQGIVDDESKFSGLPIDLGELFQEAYDKGVRIHNNSWGMAVKGLYSIDSYEVDEFVYEHPDFLVIFSAGNDGRQTDEEHPDPVDGGKILPMSLRAPATSKNALTVGACCSIRTDGPYQKMNWEKYSRPYKFPVVSGEPISGDPDVLAAFSSRGPTDDERIKPDLVAPGTVIVSTHSSNAEARSLYDKFDGQYMYLSGTSQAAPVVAGAAAIIREFYAKDRAHSQPSAALIKATLINGAQWSPRPSAQWEEVGRPNFHQGFGRIDLARTLPLPDDAKGFKLLFTDVDRKAPESLNKSTSGKGAWKRRFTAEPGIPLRLTLAWTDRPTKALQQDLDLILITPGAKKIVGNHFLKRLSAFPTDHRNNVEQVIVEEPEAGTYTVSVLAYNTPFEDQGFSLVVTGKLTSEFLP